MSLQVFFIVFQDGERSRRTMLCVGVVECRGQTVVACDLTSKIGAA